MGGANLPHLSNSLVISTNLTDTKEALLEQSCLLEQRGFVGIVAGSMRLPICGDPEAFTSITISKKCGGRTSTAGQESNMIIVN